MRRLRLTAQIYAIAVAGQGDAGRDTENRVRLRADPATLMTQAAAMMGPPRVPDDAFAEETIARLLGTRADG